MRIRVLGVALLSACLSGCWVLDELDAGAKKMDQFSGKSATDEPAEEELPATRGPRQRISDYFASQKNARTLTPGQMSSEIVSCKLGGSTQFMKQSECVSRGGVPRP